PLLGIHPGLPGDGGVLCVLRGLSHRLAGHRDLSHRVHSDVRIRDRAEAGHLDVAAVAQRLDLRACGAHLHRLRGAVPELWRQPALSGARAGVEVQALDCAAYLAASVTDHCRNRLSFLALRFPLHDAGANSGFSAGHRQVRAAVLLRSKDIAVVHHVGGVHAVAVHPLEFWMARPPRGVPRDFCLCHRFRGLGGEQLQPYAQVSLMNFVVIGVNHQTAPVEVREQFAISEARLPEAGKSLATYPGVEEGMIVSTCNRVEMVARTTNGSADLQGFLRQFYGFDPEPYRKYLYEHRERDAVRHVFRVASSLDSMIVGEPQILGQVKEAYAM